MFMPSAPPVTPRGLGCCEEEHLADGQRQHAEGHARHAHDDQADGECEHGHGGQREHDGGFGRHGLRLQQQADAITRAAEEQRVAEAGHAVLPQQQAHAAREHGVDDGLGQQRQQAVLEVTVVATTAPTAQGGCGVDGYALD
jgi:hypothetical protein